MLGTDLQTVGWPLAFVAPDTEKASDDEQHLTSTGAVVVQLYVHYVLKIYIAVDSHFTAIMVVFVHTTVVVILVFVNYYRYQ